MQRLFKRESHYLVTAFLLVCIYVLFMSYLFPRSWADTSTAIAITKAVSSVVPMVGKLQKLSIPTANYWGIFSSFFWIILAPILWVLGYLGMFYATSESFIGKTLVKHIEKDSNGSYILIIVAFVVVWFIAILFASVVQIKSENFGINQISPSLPVLLYSWNATGLVVPFVSGRITCALIRKIQYRQKIINIQKEID